MLHNGIVPSQKMGNFLSHLSKTFALFFSSPRHVCPEMMGIPAPAALPHRIPLLLLPLRTGSLCVLVSPFLFKRYAAPLWQKRGRVSFEKGSALSLGSCLCKTPSSRAAEFPAAGR